MDVCLALTILLAAGHQALPIFTIFLNKKNIFED
jgi:hypothetical protein